MKASRCSFCPLPRVAATVARLFPEVELAVQPGAGHFPWLDDPFRFSGTVETFLRG
ncbi:alpha/beta fold hydrolase [Streptomyces sp. NPDC000133]|uniref:alpha/beta fold hydrolase n=1 Tax=Streptomyces sp. NPDC000133 TaxID=3364535 RepID=UPI0036D0EC67